MATESSAFALRLSRSLLLTLAVIGSHAGAAETRSTLHADVAVVVNGESVPRSLLDALLRSRLAQQQEPGAPTRPATADEQRQALDDLVTMVLLRQRAVAQGLDREPQTAADLEVQHKSLLAQHLAAQIVRDTRVSDEELRAAYRELGPDTLIDVSHVLVADEAAARDLIAQMKRGTPLAALARRLSIDPGSQKRGGALGKVAASSLDPAFAQAALALRPGEFTRTPVPTEFGWHVIQLKSKAAMAKPSFESVRAQLQVSVADARVDAQLKALRERAQITLSD